ncbi:MAG: hypothetical protein OXE43_13890 [Chloroflexi bacterium]|nr:hypothetical protein [Chloroflexota bacterium]
MATIDQFVARYPRLYHMAEGGSWPSIKRHGLLSTSALLQLFGVGDAERRRREAEWRPESVTIEHPEHGVAVIRDQRPMRPKALELVLDGMTTGEWYQLLNGKTFFWVCERDLKKFLNASLYKARPHDVLTVDTREMLRRHWDRITLAPFNTGSTLGRRRSRGPGTFQRIEDYSLGDRHSDVVELAVAHHVPDIADLTMALEQRRGSGPPVAVPM